MTAPTALMCIALSGVLLTGGCAMHRGHGMGEGAYDSASGDRMARMCEMHRQMTAGKSPAEQQAAVEAHVRAMHGTATPERVAHHQQMTRMHCGAPAAPARMQ